MLRRLLMAAGWLLPLILAALFFIKGRYYDPDVYIPPAAALSSLPVPANVGEWVLDGAESLPADRMFEKINGRAGYYLQYGAAELNTGEWVAGEQRWDMYLYRFADVRGARAAYQGERPSDGQVLEDTEGYTVPGQVTVSAGVFYLQLNAQTAAADPEPAVSLARALANILDEPDAEIDDSDSVDLLALAGEAATVDAEGFLPESAFGFSMLTDVRTVEVTLDGASAVWFSAPGDADLVSAYAEELALYGGENLFNLDGGCGGSMFGSWGMAGMLNGTVWGVQDAPSRETLLQHWSALQQSLKTLLETP